MKRNMELIKLLLLDLEGEQVDLSSFPQSEQAYHAALLIEAGLAVGSVFLDSEGSPDGAALVRLTWSGHDFIDVARNQSIWKAALSVLRENGVSVSFDILQSLLTNLAKDKLGLAG